MNRELESQFTGKIYLKGITPDALDQYLARGWYRMGLSIFTTHFLFFEHKIYSAIWLRLTLKHYRFRKSLRKILQKNQSAFQTIIRPAVLDDEKEALYQKYMTAFKGRLPATLKSSLLDGQDFNPFNSMEVAVMDGDKLIGYSIFDLGKKSLTSITGVYDPAYKAYSLGLYTMLKEIEYGIQHQLSFFYPGYFVPGNSRFDYKLRIGNLDYFDLTRQSWLPVNEFYEKEVPIENLHQHLDALAAKLREAKIDHKKWIYPYFEARMVEYWPVLYLEYPVFLEIPIKQKLAAEQYHIVIFDLIQESYILLDCKSFESLPSNYNKVWVEKLDNNEFFKKILVIEGVLEYGPDLDQFFADILPGSTIPEK